MSDNVGNCSSDLIFVVAFSYLASSGVHDLFGQLGPIYIKQSCPGKKGYPLGRVTLSEGLPSRKSQL